MTVGRVVRFDTTRGYGFIAPESGGEDVFLHVNDLLIPEALVRSGVAVEFEVGQGGRGLKASAVRLAPGATPPAVEPAFTEDGEPMCDVLSVQEFSQEITELLLKAVPEMTGAQMLHLRRELLRFAGNHGWTEE